MPNTDSTTHFNQAAATWDENPTRRALTQALGDAIVARVPLRPDGSAMEYGCGTAALSFRLADKLGRIVAADTSEGMLAQARLKLAASSVRNLTIRLLDLTCQPLPAERFDFIFSAMTLHHIADVAALLAAFTALLQPGGWLALADLVTEDGSFHPDMRVPHNGFDPAALGQTLLAAGLSGVDWRAAHVLQRHGREYPVFLLTATKPSPGIAP